MRINSRTQQAMDTKLRIIQTAMRMIRANGYSNLNIRQLCEQAGISTGAFYHHFASKDDLMDEGFRIYDAELEALLGSYENNDPIDAIRFVIFNQTEFLATYAGQFAKELYITELTRDTKYSIQPSRYYYQMVLKYVNEASRKKLLTVTYSAAEITELLLRTTRGVIVDWCLHDYSYDVLACTKRDINLLLWALCKCSF